MSNPETSTFEKSYTRLEEILEKMNSGGLSLEESLKLYEEADKLIHVCNKNLQEAEKRVELLIKNRDSSLSVNDKAEPLTEEFDPTKDSLITRSF